MISEAVYFFMQIINRIKMLENLKMENVKVNGSFGNGIVYRNFESQQFKKL
jgi:hypothetical protein